MPTLNTSSRFFAVPLILLFSSCVHDVDFDQTRNIQIEPSLSLDLLNFKLRSEEMKQGDSLVITQLEDEVELNIMNDDITDDLKRAEFNFHFTNTFEHSFKNTLYFLSDNGAFRYKISFVIPPGTKNDPQVVDYTEIVEGASLLQLKMATRLKIELELMKEESDNLEGDLVLKSKANYKFEF